MISRIQNTFLRRALVVAVTPPLYLFVLVMGAVAGVVEAGTDLHPDVRAAWRGTSR